MKTTKILFTITLILLAAFKEGYAANRIAVLRIETTGHGLDPFISAQLFRTELKKLNEMDVVSTEEMKGTLGKAGLDLLHFTTDKSKIEAGVALKCNRVLVGHIYATGDKYYFNVKMFNVASQYECRNIERTYPLQPENFENFIAETLQPLFNEPENAQVTVKADSIKVAQVQNEKMEEPEYTKTSLAGPRLGYTFLTGNTAKLFKAPTAAGGYDCNPAFFQFGYQFEAQYMANGTMQGLVEFIPTITGMDQSHIFPSITLLNGLRNTRYGIEIALGPTIYIRREAKGYYDSNAQWHLQHDWAGRATDIYGNSYPIPNPYPITSRADSRGDAKVTSGVVIAVGKTFKSGNLNMPLNAYAVPSKNGWRFGVSLGFNLKSVTRKYNSRNY